MKGSLRLIRIAGIDIKLHFTFPLVLVLGGLQWVEPYGASGAAFGALLMMALFVCVALHELGHAVAARVFGIPVREIVLLPIGGLALLGRNPRRPLHELVIAAAGPAVNVVLAVILAFVLVARGFMPTSAAEVSKALAEPSAGTALVWLLLANISLFLFNLIPAFPMDGGRILRALLAWPLGFSRATRIATVVGQVTAVGLGIYGIVSGQLMLALVAVFIFLGAGQERAAEEARGLLSDLRLGSAYNKHALVLDPADRLSRVIDYLLTSYQPDFAVVHGGRLLGVVTRSEVLKALVQGEGDVYVTGVMQRDVPRLDPRLSLAEAREHLAELGANVGAVFDGERFLGLINAEDIQEALHISAFQRMADVRQRMAA